MRLMIHRTTHLNTIPNTYHLATSRLRHCTPTNHTNTSPPSQPHRRPPPPPSPSASGCRDLSGPTDRGGESFANSGNTSSLTARHRTAARPSSRVVGTRQTASLTAELAGRHTGAGGDCRLPATGSSGSGDSGGGGDGGRYGGGGLRNYFTSSPLIRFW